MLRSIAAGLVDLLAPRSCPGCTLPFDWGSPTTHSGFCRACEPLLEKLHDGPAAYAYAGPLAEAIKKLKYEGRVDFAEPLGRLLLCRLDRHLGEVDRVIPVPAHPSRLEEAGSDWVALLCAPIAKSICAELDLTTLQRVRATQTQASLPQSERAANVRGAFQATPLTDKTRVLLIDDVRTTGSTLRSASGALYRGGATRVRVLSLAGVDNL